MKRFNLTPIRTSRQKLWLFSICLLYFFSSSPLIAQTEWVINASGTGDFTNFSTALASASVLDGDILKVEGTITEQAISINKNLTIKGEGQGVSIVQANAARNTATDRVFLVNANKVVTFQDLTIQHGHLGAGANPVGNFYGAGLRCMDGSNVRLIRVTVQKNDVTSSNGLVSPRGGAIHAGDDNVTLYIEECLITDNYSFEDGGGISLGSSAIGDNIDFDMVNSVVSNNTANLNDNSGDGGGMFTQMNNSTFDIVGSTFEGNQAGDDGGAIAMFGPNFMGTASMVNCTVSGNQCGKTASRAQGGGIQVNSNSFDFLNCTFAYNTTISRDNDIGDEEGAGLWLDDSSNSDLINCLLANNTQSNGTAEDIFLDANIANNTRNLVQSCTGGDVSCPSFHLTSGANLEALANNGGPTMTHALMAGSNAINAGTSSGSPANDQRGYVRNVGAPDIGAYEFGASPPVPPAPEILVKDADGTQIPDGDDMPDADKSTDFGSVNVNGGSLTRTFTIENIGGADLSLTGNPVVSISGSSAFVITNQPASTIIPSANSTTFQITFDPLNTDCSGPLSATISIDNNDSDENPYTFDIEGTPVDNIAPTLGAGSCKTSTVNLDANGMYTLQESDVYNAANASDNCGITNVNFSAATYSCSDAGNTLNVMVTVTDAANNSSNCSASITVADADAPTAMCKTSTVELDVNGMYSLQESDVYDAVNSSDNCGITNVSFSATTYSCSDAGNNFNVMVTVADAANNSSNCNASITVADNINPCCAAPEAKCKNQSVQLDNAGMIMITTATVDDGSTASCGLQSFTVSPDQFDCNDIGTPQTVTLSISDTNGASDNCTAMVTIEDNTAPTAVCKNTTVEIQADGNYSLQESDVFDAASSSDNCAITNVSFPATTYGCNDTGNTYSIMVTVSDQAGNDSNCNASITVNLGQGLPSGWSASDIGSAPQGNNYSFDPCSNAGLNGEFSLSGSGNNATSSTTDNIAFASQTLCGDGMITAKIEGVSANGYGGLMIREGTNAGDKQVAIFSNLSNSLRHEARYTTNGMKQVSSFFKPSPIWLRLDRQGDWIFAYYSTTGVAFQYVHAVNVAMQNCVEIGLAAFTYLPGQTATATFSNVTVTGMIQMNSAPVPTAPVYNSDRLEEVQIFPNPTSGQFTVKLETVIESETQLVIYNLYGQPIAQKSLAPFTSSIEWDLQDVPSGTYYLHIMNREKANTIKSFMVVK
ncbi:MAG: choice-of-anchor D domain-containing protein [Chitinophagales bacterium]|nr:choice-of-anchor D domain-containing protein [Chitinophagales bacterium]